MTPREDAIGKALYTVTGSRMKDNRPEISFNTIARLWSVYLSEKGYLKDDKVTLTNRDVTDLLIMFKVARGIHDYKLDDTYVDIIGYASFAHEFANPEKNDNDEYQPLCFYCDNESSCKLKFDINSPYFRKNSDEVIEDCMFFKVDGEFKLNGDYGV